MLKRLNQMDPRLAHFLAFFSRVLLMAFIPIYLVKSLGNHNETMPLWTALTMIGAALFALSTALYYYERRGSHRLMRWDGLYVIFLFALPMILPFDPVVVAIIAQTGALVCLALMNFLFAKRWPSLPKKGGNSS